MSYKKYKTGTFRVSVFLTIYIEVLAFIGERNNGTEILGIYFKNMRMIVFSTPVFIWSSWFFGLWIYKGFLDLR
jgi:hypothetical protein